jgi:alcohol dehydrogenase (NADP+)
MKTLEFGNGDRMPVLGLGTWNSAPGDVYKAVKEAIRFGYRHIDCAFIYGNEAEIGQALGEAFSEGLARREQMWITSKLWNSFHAPEDVENALNQTLADLQLDYLDMFLMHWPVAIKKGCLLPESAQDIIPQNQLPVRSTWQAMESLVDNGTCKHIGVSNFSIVKLKALLASARLKPEMNQIELHPYLQQPDMLDYCSRNGIHLTAYAPLGSPGRPARLRVPDDPVLLEDPVITAIADRLAAAPAQILISWAIQRGWAVIPKSVTPQRIKQNFDALEIGLSDQDILEIDKLNRNRRYFAGGLWTIDGSPYTTANLWDDC